MFAQSVSSLWAASRGERFFKGLAEGNLFCWVFLILSVVGLVCMFVEWARKNASAPAPSSRSVQPAACPCPHCGTSLRPQATFCRDCKTWLS
jgi:hypothetical protein